MKQNQCLQLTQKKESKSIAKSNNIGNSQFRIMKLQ